MSGWPFMGLIELLGLAASVSLLAGWRLYLCVFVTGLAMRSGWIAPPTHFEALGALANVWVLAAALVGLIAEFLVDKVAWIDSLWDMIHTIFRPLGGALLAMAIVDAQDPAWQAAAFLLGGGGALLSHGAKSGARALVNASPEPVSNIIVSTGEDVATGGMLALTYANPLAAMAVAIVLATGAVVLLIYTRRAMRSLLGLRDRLLPPQGS
jgi:hypothetical protein